MSTESPNHQAAVEAAAKLVLILAVLSAEERKRAITAAMVLLGHPLDENFHKTNAPKTPDDLPQQTDGISAKAFGWMKKNGIVRGQLDHIFSIEPDNIEVIASQMPGASRRQQTVEAYVVCGLKSLLQTGEPNFADKDARAICSKVGCYDTGNHSNYINAIGNLVSGSRDTGWKLSNPGLGRAAEIVKLLAPVPTA